MLRQTSNKDKLIIQETYPDISSFVNTNLSREVKRYSPETQMLRTNKKLVNRTFLFKKRLKKDWFGVSRYMDAYTALKSGCDPNLEVFKMNLKQNYMQERTDQWVTSPVGGVPVIPLYLKGCPAHMAYREYSKKEKRVIQINYIPTVASDVESEDYIKYAVDMVNYILCLEAAGYSVDLTLVYLNFLYDSEWTSLDKGLCLKIKLKRPNEPLNLAKLVFPLTSPAMLRVACLDWVDRLPIDDIPDAVIPFSMYTDYGYPIDSLGKFQQDVLDDLNKHFSLFNGVDKFIVSYGLNTEDTLPKINEPEEIKETKETKLKQPEKRRFHFHFGGRNNNNKKPYLIK